MILLAGGVARTGEADNEEEGVGEDGRRTSRKDGEWELAPRPRKWKPKVWAKERESSRCSRARGVGGKEVVAVAIELPAESFPPNREVREARLEGEWEAEQCTGDSAFALAPDAYRPARETASAFVRRPCRRLEGAKWAVRFQARRRARTGGNSVSYTGT